MKTDLKTLRKYKVREVNNPEALSVKGYRVLFDDFKDFEFFVHRNNDGMDTWWEVSEKTTGCLVSVIIAFNRKDAIKYAHENLIEKGNDKLREAVKTVIDKYKEL